MKKLTPAQTHWMLALSLLLLMTLVFAVQNQPIPPDDWHPVQVAPSIPTLTPTVGWWGLTATLTPAYPPTSTP